MAEVAKDYKIWVGGYDWSGYHNAVSIPRRVQVKECTTYGATGEEHVGGVPSWEVVGAGYWDLDAVAETARPDKEIYSTILSLDNNPISIAEGSTIGDIGRFGYSLLAEYKPGMDLGEVLKFDISAKGTGPLLRGRMLGQVTTTEIGSSNTAALEAFAIAADEVLWGIVHCWVLGATSVDLKVQSSPNGTNTWSDRLTFTSLTAIGAEIKTNTDTITDTFWRLAYTTTGGTGIASFGALIAER